VKKIQKRLTIGEVIAKVQHHANFDKCCV